MLSNMDLFSNGMFTCLHLVHWINGNYITIRLGVMCGNVFFCCGFPLANWDEMDQALLQINSIVVTIDIKSHLMRMIRMGVEWAWRRCLFVRIMLECMKYEPSTLHSKFSKSIAQITQFYRSIYKHSTKILTKLRCLFAEIWNSRG